MLPLVLSCQLPVALTPKSSVFLFLSELSVSDTILKLNLHFYIISETKAAWQIFLMHKNASTCIQPIYKYIFVFQAKLGYVWSRKAQNAGVYLWKNTSVCNKSLSSSENILKCSWKCECFSVHDRLCSRGLLSVSARMGVKQHFTAGGGNRAL